MICPTGRFATTRSGRLSRGPHFRHNPAILQLRSFRHGACIKMISLAEPTPGFSVLMRQYKRLVNELLASLSLTPETVSLNASNDMLKTGMAAGKTYLVKTAGWRQAGVGFQYLLVTLGAGVGQVQC